MVTDRRFDRSTVDNVNDVLLWLIISMRTKKALYNILAQIAYELVATVCGLILPRLIITAFGSGYNGMVSSITQFLEYISILTLGISGSTRVA